VLVLCILLGVSLLGLSFTIFNRQKELRQLKTAHRIMRCEQELRNTGQLQILYDQYRQVEVKEEQIQKLELENKDAKAEVEGLRSQLSTAEVTIQEAQTNNASLEESLVQSTRHEERLQIELNDLSTEFAEFKVVELQAQSHIDELSRYAHDGPTKLEKSQRDNIDLLAMNTEISAKVTEFMEDLSQAQKDLEASDSEIIKLSAEMSTLEGALEGSEQALKTSNAKIATLKQDLLETSAIRNKVNQENFKLKNDLATAKDKHSEIRAKLSSTKDKLASTKISLGDSEAESTTLATDLDLTEQALQESRSKVSKLEHDLAAATELLKQSQTRITELDESLIGNNQYLDEFVMPDLDQLKADCKDLKEKLSSKESEIEVMKLESQECSHRH